VDVGRFLYTIDTHPGFLEGFLHLTFQTIVNARATEIRYRGQTIWFGLLREMGPGLGAKYQYDIVCIK